MLILTGDICDPFTKVYCDLIFWVVSNCKSVIVIAGNQKYYQLIRTMEEVETQIAKCNNYDNVIILIEKA